MADWGPENERQAEENQKEKPEVIWDDSRAGERVAPPIDDSHRFPEKGSGPSVDDSDRFPEKGSNNKSFGSGMDAALAAARDALTDENRFPSADVEEAGPATGQGEGKPRER